MRICILAPRFPFPENGGDTLRLNNVASYLKTRGHTLTLISFCDKKPKKDKDSYPIYDTIYQIRRNKLASFFYSFIFFVTGKPIQCGYYYSRRFLKFFRKHISKNKYDLYISHLLRTTKYLEKCKLFDKSIIEMSDALSKTYSLSSKDSRFSIKKIIYYFERNRIKKYEIKTIESFVKVVLVSKNDVDYLINNNPTFNFNSLAVHTNGVVLPDKVTDCRKQKNIISFMGNMRTLQNQDAALYFIDDIFPLVKKEVPDAVFEIVGAEPPDSIKKKADGKNIIVTGFVESVENELSFSKICVAPVRIAAGIQNKVLVSMASQRTVVLTNLIANAIPELVERKNCMIADKPEEFAHKCVELLKNDNLNYDISKEAYNMVKEHYSWNVELDGYEVIR